MFFDLIFMFQHYVLYRDKWQNKKKHEERLKTLDKMSESFKNMGTEREDGRLIGSDPKVPQV